MPSFGGSEKGKKFCEGRRTKIKGSREKGLKKGEIKGVRVFREE